MDQIFLEKLNANFIKKANKLADQNKPMTKLIEAYKKSLQNKTTENYYESTKISDDDLPSHFIQSSDDKVYDKNKTIVFKDDKSNKLDHFCSDTEIYKFLVEYFGYECSVTVPTYKKRKVTEKDVLHEEFTWPFLEPPKKPRTVFDNGPTREEIGEYNRRIFAAYTEYLNYENDIIHYEYNPKFIDENADEDFCKRHNDHQFKAEIESYLYNGTEYIYEDKGIIRISKDSEGCLIFSLQSGKCKVESNIDNFKLYYVEHDGKVDLLNMEDLTISRLLFSNEVHSKKFYEYFNVPCE